RLDRAGGPEAVAGRALRGGDRRLPRLLFAERDLDHTCLARVTEGRRRPVRVYVVDLVGVDAGVVHRHPHRPRGMLPGRIGLGDVLRVRGDAVAAELRVDLRSAALACSSSSRTTIPPA